ncbi:MAG: 2-dehydropantoate 2-reductase [Colwellia sp.]|nr:2-dehydropantoate 2-reductase [Colwellia sp.]
MHTVIVGQGAIGLLCYHRLSVANSTNGHDSVSLWPSKSTKYSSYSFQELNAKAEKFPLNIAGKGELSNARLIIICVKSYQVKSALQSIHHLIADKAVIILTHNGLGTFEEVNYLLKPKQCLLTLLLTQGARKIADYHIEHTGMGNSDLGRIIGQLPPTKQHQLVDYLQEGLSQVYWHENIQQAQWRKLTINCVINPLTALKDIPNGDINQHVYQEKVRLLISEVVQVAAKEEVTLSKNSLLKLINTVARNTENNTSSMRADIMAKRRTEIDYINGYVHRLGEKHQVATPNNTQLWLDIKALEDGFNI